MTKSLIAIGTAGLLFGSFMLLIASEVGPSSVPPHMLRPADARPADRLAAIARQRALVAEPRRVAGD